MKMVIHCPCNHRGFIIVVVIVIVIIIIIIIVIIIVVVLNIGHVLASLMILCNWTFGELHKINYFWPESKTLNLIRLLLRRRHHRLHHRPAEFVFYTGRWVNKSPTNQRAPAESRDFVVPLNTRWRLLFGMVTLSVQVSAFSM